MSKYTKAVVDAMNSEQYLEKFNNDPEFRLYIDGEYSQAAPKEAVAAPPQIGKRGPRDRKEVATVVAPQTRGFDPSFDDDPNANTPPAAPAAPAAVVPVAVPVDPATVVPPAPVIAPVELPERRHEYDIVDKKGRKIGGRQVFKHKTDAELIEKLTQSNINLRVMVQEIREKQLLEGTELPEETTAAQPLVLRPVLTAEERAAAEAGLQDPAIAAKSQYILDQDDNRRVQNELLTSNFESRVLLALQSFTNRNRDYVPTQDNAAKLVGFMKRRGLDPTNAKNYQRAYDVLRENGSLDGASENQVIEPVLVSAPPIVREEKTAPVATVPVVEPARISEVTPPPAQPAAQVPTGLSNADSTSDIDNPALQAPWLTIRVHLKDAKGKPTSQYQEFTNLDAIDHCDDKTLKHFINDQSPKGKALRAAWDNAEAEKQQRLATKRRGHGY
jgi:hypothetical protein